MCQKLKLKITKNLPILKVILIDKSLLYITNLLDCDSYKRLINLIYHETFKKTLKFFLIVILL